MPIWSTGSVNGAALWRRVKLAELCRRGSRGGRMGDPPTERGSGDTRWWTSAQGAVGAQRRAHDDGRTRRFVQGRHAHDGDHRRRSAKRSWWPATLMEEIKASPQDPTSNER